MTKQIAFILIIALRLFYHPSQDKNSLSPFTSPSTFHGATISLSPAGEILIHTGSSERLILKWIIGDNRPAECFQPVNEFYENTGNPRILSFIQLNNSSRSFNKLLLRSTPLFNNKQEYHV